MNSTQADSAEPAYLATFSLRCDPFAEGMDNRFFYAGTALMQRLDLLTHLTQFGESLILVSGPPGSGKTTLLSRFVAQSHPQWRLCLVDAEQFDRFTERLADAVGGGSFSNEQELLAHWASQSDSAQLLVIVIDNSEQLDEAASDHLGSLLSQAAAERIRLILFGPPEAQQELKQAFDQKSLSFTTQLLEVPRLTEEETASYLMYRLAVAGYSGESPFTPTEVRAICKAADGRPARINQLAGEALLDRQARSRSRRIRLSGGMRKGSGLSWGLAIIAVTGLAAYLGWQRFYPPPPVQDQLTGVPPVTGELPLTLPEPVPLKTPLETGAPRVEIPATVPAAPAAPATLPPVADVAAPQQPASAEPAAADTLTSAPPVTADRRDLVLPAQPLPLSPPEITPAVTDIAPAATVAQQPAAEAKTAAEAVDEETAAEEPAAASAPVADSVTPAEPAGRATAAAPAPPPASYPHREAWLLEQSEASFSLQLLGSRSEKSMLDYVRRNKLDERETAYYRGLHQGSPWYVLMYGIYPSRQAALDARGRLPEKVRRGKPWPRSLASVQQAIKEAR